MLTKIEEFIGKSLALNDLVMLSDDQALGQYLFEQVKPTVHRLLLDGQTKKLLNYCYRLDVDEEILNSSLISKYSLEKKVDDISRLIVKRQLNKIKNWIKSK